MFETLIESHPTSHKQRSLSVGFVSLMIHTALIAAAIVATGVAAQRATKFEAVATIVLPTWHPPTEAERNKRLVVPAIHSLPPDFLRNVPRIDLPIDFGGPNAHAIAGLEGGAVQGAVPVGEVYAEALVEEKPVLLSAPQARYPELLRQAGISGVVLMRAIIDTNGRAEAKSVMIVRSPNPGFDSGSRAWLLDAKFRPARVHGRAVRVLIEVPLNYRISGIR